MIEACQRATARASWASSLGARPGQVSIDPNGNLTSKTEGTDVWGYEWNANNELTRVTKNSVEQARFAYDPLGRRVEKVLGGVTTSYTYESADILREVRGGTPLRYVHGPGIDEPLAADDGTALAYFHADGLWGIVKMTNATGAVTLTRQYDAWGNLETSAGESGYAFTGREWDPETGLYYYRARYYDAKVGRFIGEDPIGFKAGINFYRYVGNHPTNSIDPSGLMVQVCCRDLDVNPVANFMAWFMQVRHCFVKTSTQEGGMGPARGGPLPMCPLGTPTKIIPHTGQSSGADCVDWPEVDEKCVDTILRTQPDTGPWSTSNNCNTTVTMIYKACTKCPGGSPSRSSEPPPPRTCPSCSFQ